MKRRLFVCFLALTMLLSLTACGASSKTAASVDSSANDHPAESPAVTEEKGYFDADTNGYDDEGRDSGGSVLENQKIIYTGDINLETTEFDEAVKALAALAEVKGGYLESSTVGRREPGLPMGGLYRPGALRSVSELSGSGRGACPCDVAEHQFGKYHRDLL